MVPSMPPGMWSATAAAATLKAINGTTNEQSAAASASHSVDGPPRELSGIGKAKYAASGAEPGGDGQRLAQETAQEGHQHR